MDVFAHTLWTNASARAANKIAEKKQRPFHISPGWAAFWGVFPDFFAFTVPFITALYSIIFTDTTLSSLRSSMETGSFDLAAYLYQFSHSIVIWALIFVAVWIIKKRPHYELFGWALHILIDIPSHSIEFYPTPFLFPVSEYRFPYGISWGNRWFMMINYTALLFVWGKIWYKKWRRSRAKA